MIERDLEQFVEIKWKNTREQKQKGGWYHKTDRWTVHCIDVIISNARSTWC